MIGRKSMKKFEYNLDWAGEPQSFYKKSIKLSFIFIIKLICIIFPVSNYSYKMAGDNYL